MANRIYPLPPSLINQMAAGEVIERPASVVKELLENALDAKAQHINIQIEASGVQLIEISDDGIGIHPDDLPLAVMAHTTSKIRTLDDLFSIHSLGFRGEALASIASVSRLSILSRQLSNNEGYVLTFDEVKQETQLTPQARTQGTTISVRDLFFNTPVRRQFLASEKTEWLQIENMVKRLALSRFDVAFHLKHKNNTIFHLPRLSDTSSLTSINARIKKIFGSAFIDQSYFFEAERENMYLKGWLGSPTFMRSQNDYQYFYLNGRLIRDKVINHAIRMAYENHLYPGRQPVFLLYLELPPEQVDVNVHPTKHEVRFREQRQVHDFIYYQLSQRLNQSQISISSPEEMVEENNFNPIIPILTNPLTKNEKIQEINFNHIKEPQAHYNIPISQTSPKIPSLDIHWIEHPYCLIKSDNHIYLSDYIRLYQSLCRQRFLREISSKTVTTRPFLVPIRVSPSATIFDYIVKKISDLEALGISLNIVDEQTFIIRSFPATLSYFNHHDWLSYWEKPTLSTDFLIDSLTQANHPPSSIGTHEIRAILEDFQHYLSQPDIPIDLKQSYTMMTSTDWKSILQKKSL